MPAQPKLAAPAIVVLDVNETLSDLDGLRPRFAELGAGSGVQQTWFAATLRDGFAITAAGGYADFAEIAVPTLAAMLSDLAPAPDDPRRAAERIVQAMSQLDLHPDVADGLRRIHAEGVRIVTLSNGSARVAESLLERAGLRELVEQCLSVSDAGRWKPAPEAYRYAVGRCGVDPGAAALVAVHPWDIDGARRAGLRAGWIARDGRPYPPAMRPPEVTGRDLPELAARLFGAR